MAHVQLENGRGPSPLTSPNSQNSEVDLVTLSAVVQKAVLVLVLLSAVLMS